MGGTERFQENGIIQIENLVKRYGSFVALDHLNLNVREGEIFGLLGPNGSGKTTVINCTLFAFRVSSRRHPHPAGISCQQSDCHRVYKQKRNIRRRNMKCLSQPKPETTVFIPFFIAFEVGTPEPESERTHFLSGQHSRKFPDPL